MSSQPMEYEISASTGNGLQHAGGKLRRLWQHPRDESRVAGNLIEARASA